MKKKDDQASSIVLTLGVENRALKEEIESLKENNRSFSRANKNKDREIAKLNMRLDALQFALVCMHGVARAAQHKNYFLEDNKDELSLAAWKKNDD